MAIKTYLKPRRGRKPKTHKLKGRSLYLYPQTWAAIEIVAPEESNTFIRKLVENAIQKELLKKEEE